MLKNGRKVPREVLWPLTTLTTTSVRAFQSGRPFGAWPKVTISTSTATSSTATTSTATTATLTSSTSSSKAFFAPKMSCEAFLLTWHS